jgi:hypothetical protein
VRTRSPELGPAAWPVAVPEDADDHAIVKASGVVTLPLHVRWSGPLKTYDLSKRAERARVYEQVLREGTDEDIRVFIDIDELLSLWNDLVLPARVRRAWAVWFRKHRGVDLAC